MSTAIGFDPNNDYLLDPQQRPESKLICGGCRRPIYFGEVFYTLVANVSEMNICTDCQRELERSATVADGSVKDQIADDMSDIPSLIIDAEVAEDETDPE